MELRPYQKSAVGALWRYWREGRGTAPLLVAPTGAGKSVIIAEAIRAIQDKNPEARVLCATHVQELVMQDYDTFLKHAPEFILVTGICCGSLNQHDTDQAVIFGTVQTLFRLIERIGHIDLLVIDEAHLIPRDEGTMYGKLISGLRGINPNMRIAGLTATPYRMDSGYLDDGPDALFDGVAFDIPLRMLIENGHLVPPCTKWGGSTMKEGKLAVRAGEFTPESQDEIIFETLESIAPMVVDRACGRRRILIFTPSVKSSEAFAARLRDAHGLPAESLAGWESKGDRDNKFERFRTGETEWLVNVNLLTTGVDIPEIDCIVLLCATKSASRYVQMVGRGLRPAPWARKKDCLVLDYGGNAIRHGPLTAPHVRENGAGNGDGKPRHKVCVKCESIIPTGVRTCPECGHEFPEPKPLVFLSRFQGDILDHGVEPTWHDVTGVDYESWIGPSGIPTVRARYRTPDSIVSKWWCPEHAPSKWPRQEFRKMHRTLTGDADAPTDADDAAFDMTHRWPAPRRILIVRPAGKDWPEVLQIEY